MLKKIIPSSPLWSLALKPIDEWHKEFVDREVELAPPEMRMHVRNVLRKPSLRQGCAEDIKVALQRLQWTRSMVKSTTVSKR